MIKTAEVLERIRNKHLDAGLLDNEKLPDSDTPAPTPALSRFKPLDDVKFFSPLLNCGHYDDRVFANQELMIALGGTAARVVIVQDEPGKRIGVVTAKPLAELTKGVVKGHSLDGIVPEGYGLWATDEMLLKADEYEERVKFLRDVRAKEQSPERKAAVKAAREYINSINSTIVEK